MELIDLHTHLSWNVDDGISTQEECKKALEIAKEQSIVKIVSTVHIIPGSTKQEDIVTIKNRIEELKILAKEYDIEIYAGCELFLNYDYLNSLDHHLFIPIENTDYLLVEFDVRKELEDKEEVEDRLYEIQCASYKPVIAHVERYFHKDIDLDRIQDWIDSGYVIQVNSTSILGIHGKQIQRNAMKLIEKGMVHIIASDAHRCTGHRIPNLKDTYIYLNHKVSKENLYLLMYENPLRVLNNQEVLSMKIEKKSFIKKLLGGK